VDEFILAVAGNSSLGALCFNPIGNNIYLINKLIKMKTILVATDFSNAAADAATMQLIWPWLLMPAFYCFIHARYPSFFRKVPVAVR
jgi:hypothetical protein